MKPLSGIFTEQIIIKLEGINLTLVEPGGVKNELFAYWSRKADRFTQDLNFSLLKRGCAVFSNLQAS